MTSDPMRLIERALLDPDALVVAMAWLVGSIGVSLAYWIGGLPWLGWVQRKRGRPDDWRFVSSGAPLEIAVLTFAAVLLLIVDAVTENASLLGFLAQFPTLAAGMMAIIVGWCVAHTVVQSRNDPSLARGYPFYLLFNIVLFSFYAAAGALVLWQLGFDYDVFKSSHASLVQKLGQLGTRAGLGADARLVEIEAINNLHWSVVSDLTEQINTLFLVFFFVLGMTFLRQHTPVKAAYTEGGVRWTGVFLGFVLVLVLGASWFLYNTLFLDLMTATGAAMEKQQEPLYAASLAGQPGSNGAGIMKRYFEIVTTLRDRRGITGFALTLANERGGVLLFLWLLQATLGSRVNRLFEMPAGKP